MHPNHYFWWRFFPRQELTQIYISAAIRSFSLSLISLFIPLYLYQEMGVSFSHTLYFYFVYSLALALISPLAAKFTSKYGCKHSVLISVPIYMLFILLLYLLPVMKVPLIIIGIILGASLAFYWMGMHLIFCHASDHKHRGEELGKREGISILATMLGPFLGGLMIKFAGFKLLFLVTSLFLFASAFCLFFSKENRFHCNFSFRTLWDKKYWKDSLFFISRGTRVIAAGVIWPLFIFIILRDYLSLGITESILAGASAVLLWLVGKYSDHINKHILLKIATLFESISWFLRAGVSTVAQVFGVTVFGSLTYGIFEAPAGALEYDKAKSDLPAYFVKREMFICLGRMLLLCVVLGIFILTGGLLKESLVGGVIFNGIAVLAGLLF
ncbi:MFS transporter [Candidatus Woesearchaeota archaeon]|nr:MFS transporter [Candidatus Woesearchaeota archaeon]